MQARQVREAAMQKGMALEDAALDSLAEEIAASAREEGQQRVEKGLESNETMAFIEGLKAEQQAKADEAAEDENEMV
jgi:hypothetical protein